MKFTIQTFGCAMNYSDSERIETVLNQIGFIKTQDVNEADLIIFNTCSIKQKAEDKVFGFLRKYYVDNQYNPNLRIGITGCMVRKTGVKKTYSKELYSKDPLLIRSPYLDFVFRIEDTPNLPKFISAIYGQDLGKDYSDDLFSTKNDAVSYMEVRPTLASTFQAFVPIQTGCNKFCTYCIVPFTRKREQNRKPELILSEIKDLVKNGCKEVTLVGQTVNSYNPDNLTKTQYKALPETPFVSLLKEINKISGLDRIRYTSPHPTDMTDDLIFTHRDLEKMCPYIHLPIQSGSDKILQAMKRPYTRAEYLEIIRKIKQNIPNVVISTDIIVGFPGETDADFEETYELFKQVGFDMSFTSRYSPRSGTVAHDRLVYDVPASVKASRWHKLNDLLREISHKKNEDLVGSTQEILVENTKGIYIEGRARNYKLVQIEKKSLLNDVVINIGDIVKVKIIKGLDWALHGEYLI